MRTYTNQGYALNMVPANRSVLIRLGFRGNIFTKRIRDGGNDAPSSAMDSFLCSVARCFVATGNADLNVNDNLSSF